MDLIFLYHGLTWGQLARRLVLTDCPIVQPMGEVVNLEWRPFGVILLIRDGGGKNDKEKMDS